MVELFFFFERTWYSKGTGKAVQNWRPQKFSNLHDLSVTVYKYKAMYKKAF